MSTSTTEKALNGERGSDLLSGCPNSVVGMNSCGPKEIGLSEDMRGSQATQSEGVP